MIKFSALTWCVISAFLLSFVAVMLNSVTPVMVYVALSLLLISFVLLTVKLYLDISKKSKEDERIKEELLMELAVTEDGEEYVMKNSPTSKKYRKMLRKEHFNRFMPVIFSGFVALCMAFLLIKVIFRF